MEQQFVLIQHYINGYGVPRWCAEVFCEDPKDLAQYIESNLDDLYHQLDDEYDHYSIERRIGSYCEEYFHGSLEELIDTMRNQ